MKGKTWRSLIREAGNELGVLGSLRPELDASVYTVLTGKSTWLGTSLPGVNFIETLWASDTIEKQSIRWYMATPSMPCFTHWKWVSNRKSHLLRMFLECVNSTNMLTQYT